MYAIKITPKSITKRGVQTISNWASARGAQFAGIGRRSPIMANGQVPGIRRLYDTNYALVLQEQQGPVAR